MQRGYLKESICLVKNKQNLNDLLEEINLIFEEKIVQSPNWIVDFKDTLLNAFKKHLKNFKKGINKYLDLIYKAINKLPKNLEDGIYNIVFEKDHKKKFEITFNVKGINVNLEDLLVPVKHSPIFLYDVNTGNLIKKKDKNVKRSN